MKTKLIALALGFAAVAAQASPTFAFKNVPAGWDGRYSIKLAGFESFSNGLAVGSQNYGVLKITSISTIGFGTTTIWSDGDNGAELTGVFSGISVSSFNGIILNAVGGSADFYLNPFGTYAGVSGAAQGMGGYAAAGGGCAVNMNCYNGVSNVGGGSVFLKTSYVPGVYPSDPTATVSGVVTATSPLTGVASGYLAITGGDPVWSNYFNTNGFLAGAADLFAKNSFCTVGTDACATIADAGGIPGAGGWQLAIDDPVKGSVKLPEPASIALVGLGLLGAGMIRRRKA